MRYVCRKLLALALALIPVIHAVPVARAEDFFGGIVVEEWDEDGASDDVAALETLGSGWKRKVVVMNWYKGGSKLLKRGAYGYLYDISSGLAIKIKRCGGTAHADVEPATKSDAAKLKKMGHGHYSWSRRAGILHVRGKYVAVSFNTKPHGKQTIRSNGYNGQFCLHMAYSRTHGSNRVDAAHMRAIRRAYNWAH